MYLFTKNLCLYWIILKFIKKIETMLDEQRTRNVDVDTLYRITKNIL